MSMLSSATLSSTNSVGSMVGREDKLFRRFRLPWVPAWVPDWAESWLHTGMAWKVVPIGGMIVLGLYFGLGYGLPTERYSGDVAAWRSQLEGASPAELPLVLDALFQVADERVLVLGVESMTHPDTRIRQTTGLVLQDAPDKWDRWPPLEAGRQWERILRLVAAAIDRWHAPEQALAVQLAQRGLARPFPSDTESSTFVLAHIRQIIAQANPAHSVGFRWDVAGRWGEIPSEAALPLGDSTFSTRGAAMAGIWGSGDESLVGRGTGLPASAGDANRRFLPNAVGRASLAPAGFGTTATGNASEGNLAPRLQVAGFASQGNRSGGQAAGGGDLGADANFDGSRLPSQVPLFDDTGRLIEVLSLDPATLAVPGGLIPVDMSRRFRARAPESGSVRPEGPTSETGETRTGRGATGGDSGERVGPSRVAGRGQPIGQELTMPDHRVDRHRLELEAAWQRRGQAMVASGPGVPRSLIGGQSSGQSSGEPSVVFDERIARRQLGSAAGSSSASLADTAASSGLSVVQTDPAVDSSIDSAGPSAGGVRALEIATSGHSRLPANPYRMDHSQGEGHRVSRNAGRAAAGSEVLQGLSHIEVMQRMGAADAAEVGQAVQELRRRGFDANDIAVARRMISADARERYQLVLDLMGSNRVEPTPFLRWLTGDEDPAVRALAVEALEMLNAAGRNRAVDASPGNRRTR